jgi:ubiquinone/menaquinone biosynthesis C-methylase UbiE
MSSSAEQMSQEKQMALVRDRFTRTAGVFADYVLNQRVFEAERVLRLVAPAGSEHALDVACGPATLARIFAPYVRWIVGLDLTPAMLERARREAAERELGNFCAMRGNALETPFRDESFDIVVTSYSIHHLPDAAAALREMARLTKRGGKFGMLDMIVSADAAAARKCNEIEIARDPSHTRALPASEFEKVLASFGLRIARREIVEHPRRFDQWMGTAGWRRGDAEYEATRKLMESSIAHDDAGLRAKFSSAPSSDSADARPDIEFIHTALYLCAEKQ